MTKLQAQPYDISASGFYFDRLEDYQAKVVKARNDYGDPIEEFEIQFIDGDHIDCDLAKAWRINQANIGRYFEAVDDWDDYGKQVFIIAVGEAGYRFDPETVSPADFDVNISYVSSMRELAEQFVEEGLFGDIPGHLSIYIDVDAIARDLAFDYTETEIAGQKVIYRVG
ncbi:antirestriction protein ArdA [uncultured Roseovarius sp.]|uniref:antirestriction protein ArdA n=1 Tax=uncultured Roseovarius sp. TaxID=293344 RepID=UPI00260CD19C|nr:antirestriction protein ArdA [uncultured Roseovarius sp.]